MLFSITVNAIEPNPDLKKETKKHWELGSGVYAVLPNRLPKLDENMVGISPIVVFPTGLANPIQVEFLYASERDKNIYVLDTSYKLQVDTPFILGYLLFGPHFLYYKNPEISREYLGFHLGFGAKVPCGKGFSVQMDMKLFFQERTVARFGGGFLVEM